MHAATAGPAIPKRPARSALAIFALWLVFYGSFTLFTPALLDDADSVHAEVAREMLLRHDYVTLYANGIRYLEKAPLLYWSMAASMRASQALGYRSANRLAVAARVPLALTMLALAFVVEAFAQRAFRSARAGLYAALVLLSSFGVFLFSRILLPDAMLCLWITLALYFFWLAEGTYPQPRSTLPPVFGFAACCALGVLTKGLIGVVFPVAIACLYLCAAHSVRGAVARIRRLRPLIAATIFLAIAAPWHSLIALANPAEGHPGGLTFAHGHWSVPLPTDGNVHGWAWFYFINEQALRYLNLRVPRDYDTIPLWLFWGLCLVWLMPWSAFLFPACRRLRSAWRAVGDSQTLLAIFAAVPLLFFSLSTRQEYYVLPSLPPLAILIGGWLASDNTTERQPAEEKANDIRRAALRCTAGLVLLGAVFAACSAAFLFRVRAPAANAELAALLHQNPADYAMSMGHFLDLNVQALALFRPPLAIAAATLFLGPLASYFLRRRGRPHAATLALAAGAFGFLLAAHLGLRTFAPVLTSQQLAAAVAPQIQPEDLLIIHQEYEYGSTLGFYLQRPAYDFSQSGQPVAVNPIRILTDADHNGTATYGRSSNLWYGSFFSDAPHIFETAQTLAAKWRGPQRIFLWQDLGDEPSPLPALPGPVYIIAKAGGKEIVSNQPDRR